MHSFVLNCILHRKQSLVHTNDSKINRNDSNTIVWIGKRLEVRNLESEMIVIHAGVIVILSFFHFTFKTGEKSYSLKLN